MASGVLKEQLFYGGMGGGGDEGDLCEDLFPEPGSELPITIPEGRSDFMGMLETHTFCIFGFPFDEDITMTVQGPDGTVISESLLHVNSAEIENGVRRLDENLREWLWIGEAQVVDGIPIGRLYLWVPLGLPYGEWFLTFEIPGTVFGGTFENKPPEGMAISLIPEGAFNMFPAFGCETFGPDETLKIYGHGFEPNTALPLGVYVDSDWADSVLVDSLAVPTGEQGEFAAWIRIKDLYPEGYYRIIPNEAVLDDMVQNVDATSLLHSRRYIGRVRASDTAVWTLGGMPGYIFFQFAGGRLLQSSARTRRCPTGCDWNRVYKPRSWDKSLLEKVCLSRMDRHALTAGCGGTWQQKTRR